jgi:hypothetical protein
MSVDMISFGPEREPRRWRPSWRLPAGRTGRLAWLVVAAVAIVALIVTVLATSSGHARRNVSEPSLPRLLTGIPAHRIHARLFLGGENLWWIRPRPQAVAAAFLHNGLSPLLPSGHGAEVDQLAAVRGGVVAHLSDISTGITYGALGRVVFIPAANAPARVIGRATMIAVAPGGQRVWVQTAVQTLKNGQDAPANIRSPTWAVSLTGRRVSPVLRLPFGLVGATEKGPLTQNLATGRLQLWDDATGRRMPLPVPKLADFVAIGSDRLVWDSYAPSPALHITDLRTGSDAEVLLPRNWVAPSLTYPPPPASFDQAGQRLALPLDRTDSAGNVNAAALFVVDIAARTLRMIPSKPLPFPLSAAGIADTLVGSWDQHGLLWVLAMSPYYGYYQLGFWTGAGPLHTFQIARGSPMALLARGPS